MAATDRTSVGPALAERVGGASFVQLLVRADGECLAAGALLVGALASTETPYQVRVVRTRADVDRFDGVEGGTVVGVGTTASEETEARPAVAAFEAAEAVGAAPESALAVAGVIAAGDRPEEAVPTLLDLAGLERRPGLAVPTTDLADGLAHTTAVHTEYTGDPDAAEALVERVGEADADRRLASLLAIDAVTGDEATERAAAAIERAIHPLDGGPLVTVEGLADVLGALAAAAPGLAVGRTLGSDAEPALEVWREHALAAHAGVRGAVVDRHDGLVVADVEGPVETIARLVRDYRSPEPAVLAVGDGEAALATVDEVATPIEGAAEAAGGSGLARGNHGYARFDDRPAFVDAVREAM